MRQSASARFTESERNANFYLIGEQMNDIWHRQRQGNRLGIDDAAQWLHSFYIRDFGNIGR